MTRNRQQPRLRSGWKILWIIGVLILSGCQGAIPERIVGTWATQDQRYQDRNVQITSDTITFVVPEGNMPGSIRKVRTTRQGPIEAVKITYVDGEKEHLTIELLYSAENGGSFSFKNQPNVVWRKVIR